MRYHFNFMNIHEIKSAILQTIIYERLKRNYAT